MLESVPCCHRLVVVGQNVIPYATQLLTRPEQRYCVTRKELLVVVEFVHHFRHYLLEQESTLQTDHGSLVWLRNFKELEVNWLAGWGDSGSITSPLFIVKDCVIVTLMLFPVFHAGEEQDEAMDTTIVGVITTNPFQKYYST